MRTMICLDARSGVPIYLQIKENLLQQIMSRTLLPDTQLPSVRELAADLVINPNTIQRAYRELENEGYVYKVPGKGCFVATPPARDEKRIAALTERFRDDARKLMLLGVSGEELSELIRSIQKEGLPYDADRKS